MLIAEYNYEEDIAVQREEAYEEGVEAGMQKGELLGIELTKKVFRLKSQNVSISDIASQCRITEEKVIEILKY